MRIRTHLVRLSYGYLLRPILFLLNPESVHQFFLRFGSFLGRFRLSRALNRWFFSFSDLSLEQDLADIHFKNPVGLSAGFDKDGDLLNVIPDTGFGFMEVGSTTLKPYPGNPHPWLLRLKKSKSILVNFGLKNDGVKALLDKFSKTRRAGFPYAISIAKSNCTETADEATGIQDYVDCTHLLEGSEAASFYVLNISCPNAFGGEPFTEPQSLGLLLEKIMQKKPSKPIFVKMPINLPWTEFEPLLALCVKHGVAGVVIGNLNKNRQDPALHDKIPEDQPGSMSGKPCCQLSNRLIEKTYARYRDSLYIIGVGGIFSAEDAYQKIRLGASLVALVTGMIYQGPQLASEINQGLVKLLKRDGYTKISEAVGSKAPRNLAS